MMLLHKSTFHPETQNPVYIFPFVNTNIKEHWWSDCIVWKVFSNVNDSMSQWFYECKCLYSPLKAGPPFPWAVQNFFRCYLITLQNAILDCMKHIIPSFIAFKDCQFILDKVLVIYMSHFALVTSQLGCFDFLGLKQNVNIWQCSLRIRKVFNHTSACMLLF